MTYTLNPDYSLSAPPPRGGGLHDEANLQGCVDWLAATYGGGKLILAPGSYQLGSQLVVKKGVKLVGQGRQVTYLCATADHTVLAFDTTCTDASGFTELSVIGWPYQNAVNHAVVLGQNIRPVIDHATIWYGCYAMYTLAVDARFYDVWFSGSAGGVISQGASAYAGCKFDSNGSFPSLSGCAFWQGTAFSGSNSLENWFTECDFNGPWAGGILVQTNQSSPYGITKFLQCNIGVLVNISQGYITTFNACWFYDPTFVVNGGGVGIGGQVIVDGCAAIGMILTTPSGIIKSANFGIV